MKGAFSGRARRFLGGAQPGPAYCPWRGLNGPSGMRFILGGGRRENVGNPVDAMLSEATKAGGGLLWARS
jgi:hypothetical protein